MLKKLAAIILAVAIAAFLWFNRAKRPEVDRQAVVAQVQRLNQLATVKYTVQKVVGLEEPKTPVGAERILLILQATVTAGVDLSRLKPEDITVHPGGGVLVRLPEAQILNVTVDENETRVWDRQTTWWTPWIPYSKDLEQKARKQGLESIRGAAIQMGILTQAQQNAESAIRGLLELAGVKPVIVVSANAS
jgi:uncharacterized protein DUF4230